MRAGWRRDRAEARRGRARGRQGRAVRARVRQRRRKAGGGAQRLPHAAKLRRRAPPARAAVAPAYRRGAPAREGAPAASFASFGVPCRARFGVRCPQRSASEAVLASPPRRCPSSARSPALARSRIRCARARASVRRRMPRHARHAAECAARRARRCCWSTAPDSVACECKLARACLRDRCPSGGSRRARVRLRPLLALSARACGSRGCGTPTPPPSTRRGGARGVAGLSTPIGIWRGSGLPLSR